MRMLRNNGFTFIEMIAVMVVTAIVAVAVGVFLKLPVKSYQDAQKRQEITDAADTAFRRMIRDLQTALPNSVRLTNAGGIFYLEFLQTRTGGRYRAAHGTETATCPLGTGDGDVLAFGAADTCFLTFGGINTDPPNTTIATNSDYLVVYNLGPGYTNADAYAAPTATSGNRSLITAYTAGASGEDRIDFQAHTFSLASPGNRFQVVSGPVSYVCSPNAATPANGTLIRYTGYAIAAAQPTPPVGGSSARIAQGITSCTITYDQTSQRTGIISLWMGFSDPGGGAAFNLVGQAQINNVP